MTLMDLVRAIVAGDAATVSRLLASSPDLAKASTGEGATRQISKDYYLEEVGHYLYAGDTALQIAAGADIRARNRRGAEPLHYAADGAPGTRTWSPDAQAATITLLTDAGADP